MSELSVRKIPGIGRMTELTLGSLQVYKCKDIIEKAMEIYISFSDRTSSFLLRSALGIARCFHEDDDDDGI
jgi:DNA polymerase kappa